MTEPAADTAPDAAPALSAQETLSAYLTFRIADDAYGIDILKVHEIVALLPVTPLHGSPPAVSGVVNLRGSVVPVMSLRALFNLGAGSASPHRVFIIIDHDQELIGLAVDQVLEVVRFTPAQIGPSSGVRAGMNPAFIRAIGTGHGRTMHLLAIEQILSFPGAQVQSP